MKLARLNWGFLDWELITQNDIRGDLFFFSFIKAMITLLATVFGMLVAGGVGSLLDLFLPYQLSLIAFVIPVFMAIVMVFGSKFYILDGIDETKTALRDEGWYLGSVDTRSLMKRHLKLSKEDKALFPSNILDEVRKPYSQTDRVQLNRELDSIFNKIKARDEQRAKLEELNYPVDDILAELNAVGARVDIETETLKEYG